MEIMVTQTWSYFRTQLDFPKSKRIKAHILRPGTRISFCGLENVDDVGEMSWQDFLKLGPDACTKCRRACPEEIKNVI